MFKRTRIAMIVAEFLGAATLAVAWLAVSRSGVGFALFISAAVGFAYGLLALTIGSASGGQYNPAVTVALWSVRRLRTVQTLVFVAMQFLGGLAGGTLFVYLSGQNLTDIAGSSFEVRVLVAEAVGAFVVSLGVAAATTKGYKGIKFATTVGGALFVGMLLASVAANGLANPSLALAAHSWGTAYVAGPLLGAIIGTNLYVWLFAPAEARPKLRTAKSSVTKVAVTKTKTVAKPKAVAPVVKNKPTTKKTVTKKSAKKTSRKK
jgi:aquaporin Z